MYLLLNTFHFLDWNVNGETRFDTEKDYQQNGEKGADSWRRHGLLYDWNGGKETAHQKRVSKNIDVQRYRT